MGFGLSDLWGPAGIVMALLLAMSLVSAWLILLKILDLWGVTGGAAERTGAARLIAGGRTAEALAALGRGRSPADRAAFEALSALLDGDPETEADARAERLAQRDLAGMRRHLRLLDVIAMTAPLLGLLGTVLGMILSFQDLEMAGGAANASVLAGGIWQALLTTAAGLIVAIPAAVAAQLLGARVERAGHLMEDAVAAIMAAHRRRQAERR